MIQPQLAVGLEWEKIPQYSDYSMEPKLDGVRCIVERDATGAHMYTRTGRDLAEKLPHLVTAFESIDERFILDGEIGYIANYPEFFNYGEPPIMDFNATMRVIGSNPDVALYKQRTDMTSTSIHFIGFDMLRWGLDDLRDNLQQERRRNLITFCGLHLEQWMAVNYVQTALVTGWNEEAYVSYVNSGGEGVILKNPCGRYVEGKRPANNWYKVKKFETIDVVITGYTPGQGKYEGLIGAIEFEYEGKQFKCSGMDDLTRETITGMQRQYIGSVIEVRHFGFVGADQSGLRFPQFQRFRPDKEPQGEGA